MTKDPHHKSLRIEQIITAAIELADTGGIDAVSMRKLAKGLGVTAMALYNHVSDRDGLIDGMVDTIIATFYTPVPNLDWKREIKQRAHSVHDAFLKHRWMIEVLASRITVGPAALADSDATIGCLRAAGFDFGQIDWVRHAIDSHIYGYTLLEINYPVAEQDYQSTADDFLDQIPFDKYPNMHAAAKYMIDGHYDGITQFDFGLDILLNGVARWQGAGS